MENCMAMTEEVKMYENIGRAVAACQFFEFTFTLIVKLMFKDESATRLDELTILNNNSFKPAVTSLLNELKQKITVTEDFEIAITEFSERRHTLIHRWFIKNNWPATAQEVTDLSQYAISITTEAMSLASYLMTYLTKLLKKFPEFKELAEQQEASWLARLEQSGLSMCIRA